MVVAGGLLGGGRGKARCGGGCLVEWRVIAAEEESVVGSGHLPNKAIPQRVLFYRLVLK
jgi:hypothetical protein